MKGNISNPDLYLLLEYNHKRVDLKVFIVIGCKMKNETGRNLKPILIDTSRRILGKYLNF